MNIKKVGYVLFVFGFLYYVFVPAFLLILFDSNIVVETVRNKFEYLHIYEYFRYAIIYFTLFSIGFLLFFNRRGKVQKYFDVKLGLRAKLFIAFIATAVFFTLDYSQFMSMTGYLDGYDIFQRGQLSTLLLTLVWWYVYLSFSDSKKCMIKNFIVFLIALVTFNLLALGSRLSVITSIVAFGLYFIATRKLYLKHMLVGLVIISVVVVFMTIVGVYREGSDFGIEGFLFSIFAEPVFIYASVPAYLTTTAMSLFEFPIDIFLGIMGGVPSIVFQNKVQFFEEMSKISVEQSSGFGGVNHIINIIANFGLIGFLIFSFLEGLFFAKICQLYYSSTYWRTVTVLTLSILPFMFFRDGYLTTVKLVLTNFIFVPFLILYKRK